MNINVLKIYSIGLPEKPFGHPLHRHTLNSEREKTCTHAQTNAKESLVLRDERVCARRE